MAQSIVPRKVVVVGAGPVGCLAAIMFAKRDWNVEIYEARPDMRVLASKLAVNQRSINLALSHRGITAIQAVDHEAAQRVLQTAIPMRGRLIHGVNGKLDSQLYDKDGQCINSIDRALLNESLLEHASNLQNIRITFSSKVQLIDFDAKSMKIRDLKNGLDFDVHFDLCIGADGSYSIVRRQMMKAVRMNYQQEYLEDEYVELRLPAGMTSDGKACFQLDPGHLHIWPRHSFMLIALPNKDKTFTCTLFAPKREFDRLTTSETIISWFKLHFPDALPLMGEKNVVNDLTHNPRSPLICTKANPYHYSDRAILLGDAAHSMVPFYGQGLNCGLEDVRVLQVLFSEANVASTAAPDLDVIKDIDRPLASALARYSCSRHEDLLAISDLAMDNYVEMRHSVTTPAYIFRKSFDTLLYSFSSQRSGPPDAFSPLLSRILYPAISPRVWLPLYTMVTFRPDISYSSAKKKAAKQSRIIMILGWLGGVTISGVALLITRILWCSFQR